MSVKRTRVLPITLSLVLLLIALPSLHIPVAHGAIYTPGVTVGQYVDYGQISFQSNGNAFNMQAFNHTIDLRDTVTNVNGNNVTISETATFDNGTAPHTEVLQGNVATGAGNLTFAVIAGGLVAGDPVTESSTVQGFSGFSSFINETVTRYYAGALRSVNVGIQQPSLPGVTFRSAVYWDAQTGFALELFLTSFIPAGIISPNSPASTVSLHLKATSTNAWSTADNSDFGLDIASLSSFTIYQGSSNTVSVNLTSVEGFTGTVYIQAQLSQANSTVTNAPAVSLSYSSVTLDSGQSVQSSLQITATTLTNLGNYLITVNATTASLKHDGIFVVEVVPPDFELSPDTILVSVPKGTTVSTTLTVRPLGAFSGTVLMSSFVIDPGLQISLNTTNVALSPGQSVNVQVNATAASTVATATYFAYVIADSGTQSHVAYVIINVIQLSPPTVVITSVSPNPASAGDSVIVIFGVYSLPTVTGISVNWGDGTTTDSLAATASSDTHVFTSTGNDKSETFKITINATNTVGVGSATYMETVIDQLPTASITSVSPTSAYVGQTLTLSFSAADPDGTVASANVDWGDGTNSALTGTATQATHPYGSSGSFTIEVTVTDNSGNIASSSTTATIPQPDIDLASTSPSSTTTGQSTTSTITVSPVNGFTGTVTLGVSAPSGVTCALDYTTLQPSGTVILTCTSSTANDYTVTVTATGGAAPHTTTETFHFSVATPPDITVTSTTPASTNAGQSSTSTITVSPVYGFVGTVTLSVSAPSGITCTLDHATLQGSGSATLTCTSSTPNEYTVMVTATGGPASHTTTQTFHVSAAPSPAAPAPTILDLPPVVFYGLIGVLVAAVIGGIAVMIRRKNP